MKSKVGLVNLIRNNDNCVRYERSSPICHRRKRCTYTYQGFFLGGWGAVPYLPSPAGNGGARIFGFLGGGVAGTTMLRVQVGSVRVDSIRIWVPLLYSR